MMKNKKYLNLFVTLFALAGFFISGCLSDPKPEDLLIKLLPESKDLQSASERSKPKVHNPRAVWDHLDKESDLFYFNGNKMMVSADYSTGGSRKLRIELYDFEEPIQVYGIYTHYRQPYYKFPDLGAESFINNDTLMLRRGTYLVAITRHGAMDEAGLISAGKAILTNLKGENFVPKQMSLFPQDGFVANSERLLLDDFLNQSDLVNVYCADYKINDDSCTLYMKVDPNVAAHQAVRQFIDGQGAIKEYLMDAGFTSFLAESETYGNVYCGQKDDVLCIITGYQNKATAIELSKKMFEKLGK